MLDMLKRHEIQVLRRAGHSQVEVARLAGTSERTVRRVEDEPAVVTWSGSGCSSAGSGGRRRAEAFRGAGDGHSRPRTGAACRVGTR